MRLKEAEQLYSSDHKGLVLSGQDLAGLVKQTLAKGACFRLKAQGYSMLPFIRNDDILTVSPLTLSPITVGSVVAFISHRTGRLVIHRIIGKKNGRYFLKGDSTLSADGLMVKDHILGCLTKVERSGKAVGLGSGRQGLIVAFLSRIRVWYFAHLLWRFIR